MPKIGVRPKKRLILTIEGSADNALTTITVSGVAGKSHYVVGVVGVSDAASLATLEMLDDVTTKIKWNLHLYAPIQQSLPGMIITVGNDLVLKVGASGTVGKFTKGTLIYYTE